jgi:NADH-quinone oxidoreductase subunit E
MAPASEDYTGLLSGFPREERQLLPMLEAVQAERRYLPEEALRAVSSHLELPLARVFAVASFYKALSLSPKGEKLVRVCRGTACHLRGAPQLIAGLEESLGVSLGETEKSGRFTLEAVNCLGACALAPVVTVDDTVYGRLTAASAKKILI